MMSSSSFSSPARFVLPVAVVIGAGGCADPSTTRVALEVISDPTLGVDRVHVRVGDHDGLGGAGGRIELLIGDDLAGQDARIEVAGFAQTRQVAFGAASVTPIRESVVELRLTLGPVSCPSSCFVGADGCASEGRIRCERDADGCGRWTVPVACPTATPFCSVGECLRTCTPSICTSPPPAACTTQHMAKTYGEQGSCGQSTCVYAEQDLTCGAGCVDGACLPAAVVQVSAGGMHTCALRADGTLRCWGLDDKGQSTPPQGTFRLVHSGRHHSCALTIAGEIVCWGDNSLGQSNPPPGSFVGLALGAEHGCAIDMQGRVTCWGDNRYMQRAISSTSTFTAVTAGSQHTCVIRPDATFSCTGDNSYGQTEVPDGTLRSFEGGDGHSCGLRLDDTIVCWGREGGVGPSMPPDLRFASVSAGSRHTCGVSSGRAYCWGSNAYGQATPPPGTYLSISAGGRHSCAVRADQKVVCWGDDSNGQVGSP